MCLDVLDTKALLPGGRDKCPEKDYAFGET